MDRMTLSHQIKLYPRASLLKGVFFEHEKTNGVTINPLVPHYVTSGVPVVQFESGSGEPVNIQDYRAEIECNFRETDSKIQSIATRLCTGHILVQLAFGKEGGNLTKANCRLLREASGYFSKLITSKNEIYLAGLFILKTDGDSNDGLLVPLGIFSLEGHSVWINPEAIELGLLVAPFPSAQVEKSTKDKSHWYDRIYESLEHLFHGEELHSKVIEARAEILLESGKVKTKKAGLTLATKEADLFLTNTAEMVHVILEGNNKARARCCKSKLTKKDVHNTNTKAINEIDKLPPPKAFSIKKIRGD